MDKVISKIASFGIPSVILIFVIATSGLAGAAAITSALALLGGSFGMLGGIAALGLIMLISNVISEYGFEKIYNGVINKLIEDGITENELKEKINKYKISKELKLKLIDSINNRVK